VEVKNSWQGAENSRDKSSLSPLYFAHKKQLILISPRYPTAAPPLEIKFDGRPGQGYRRAISPGPVRKTGRSGGRKRQEKKMMPGLEPVVFG
jgi:hypothetical protein